MPTTRAPGSVRSAATVNEDIRALWALAGQALTADQQEQYQTLLLEWAQAVRAEDTRAA